MTIIAWSPVLPPKSGSPEIAHMNTPEGVAQTLRVGDVLVIDALEAASEVSRQVIADARRRGGTVAIVSDDFSVAGNMPAAVRPAAAIRLGADVLVPGNTRDMRTLEVIAALPNLNPPYIHSSEKPHKLILLSGAIGSGKSTALHLIRNSHNLYVHRSYKGRPRGDDDIDKRAGFNITDVDPAVFIMARQGIRRWNDPELRYVMDLKAPNLPTLFYAREPIGARSYVSHLSLLALERTGPAILNDTNESHERTTAIIRIPSALRETLINQRREQESSGYRRVREAAEGLSYESTIQNLARGSAPVTVYIINPLERDLPMPDHLEIPLQADATYFQTERRAGATHTHVTSPVPRSAYAGLDQDTIDSLSFANVSAAVARRIVQDSFHLPK